MWPDESGNKKGNEDNPDAGKEKYQNSQIL